MGKRCHSYERTPWRTALIHKKLPASMVTEFGSLKRQKSGVTIMAREWVSSFWKSKYKGAMTVCRRGPVCPVNTNG
mgnify:CR=1 FL=1